jgi:hypothetical protein
VAGAGARKEGRDESGWEVSTMGAQQCMRVPAGTSNTLDSSPSPVSVGLEQAA